MNCFKKHLSVIILFALATMVFPLSVLGQQDKSAREILDKMAATYNQGDGMKISFKGTQIGTLWVRENCFVLDCNGVKSWFDGTTQWSYVQENEEVNISSPTPEEIQAVNPYVLVNMYKKGFNYRYVGKKERNGKTGIEVVLLPLHNQDIREIRLNIDANNLPFYIGIDMQNGHFEEFIVTSYEKLDLTASFFQFNARLYPNAEIIDLR